MEQLILIFILALVFIALISPGPDFVIVVRNSLLYSHRTAVFTAFGVALSNLFHISYTLLGLELIANYIVIVQYLGAGYLIYIGIKGLLSKKTDVSSVQLQDNTLNEISIFKAVQMGFLNGVLNPKAMLFFISLFSVVINPETPKIQLFLYAALIFIEGFMWFSVVAFCFSRKRVRVKFTSVSYWIDRVTGGILVFLGLKLFFSKISK